MYRASIFLIGLFLAAGAVAQEEKALAQSFQSARKVRAYERLQLLASLASSADLSKGLQGGAKGAALLPAEDALLGASWVAVVSAAGDRLAARGEAPVDIGRRAAVQKALSSFLRDDLLASPNGPIFLAAAPIGANGKVIGALVAAWPEAYQLEDFAKSSCACQAMLVVDGVSTTGDILSPDVLAPLVASFQSNKTFEVQLAPVPSQKKMAAYLPLAGELGGASYVLLFEPEPSAAVSAPPQEKDPIPQLLVLISSLLLGLVLLMILRASKRDKLHFDEASLILQLPLLYQDFLDAKARCGESIDAITQDRFSLKVRESCALFSKVYNQPRIKVAVSIKNGRVQLIATPS